MKGTLKVLMFKHLVVRVRRFIHTSVELVSPIVFFLILFAFKDHIVEPIPMSGIKYSHVMKYSAQPLGGHVKLVFYTPENNATKKLMEQVGKELGLARLDKFPVQMDRAGYYPIKDISVMVPHFKYMSKTDAIIVFQNVEDSFPDRLEYTIRMSNDFMTGRYKSLDDAKSNHIGYAITYEEFMKIQWSVDSSFLKVAKNIDFAYHTVQTQQFPFVNTLDSYKFLVLLCTVLQVLCWISLLLTFVFLMTRLLEERTTGIEELIKMMGVSSNMLSLSHFLNVVPTGLVYCVVNTALLTATSRPFLPGSNPLLIAVALALHFISVMAMAFACSYLIKNTQYAVSLSLFAYIALWVPAQALSTKTVPGPLCPLAALLPHVPLNYFWLELVNAERFETGLTWTNAWSAHTPNTCSVMYCLVAFILQTVLFSLLAWYLSLVNPGPYGHALPWGFILKREFWSQRKVTPDVEVEKELEEPIAYDPVLFEEAPKDHHVGIRIDNVSKVFGKNTVLSNLSMDIYKGEITVLLGHNGAGKTTLMNIITGKDYSFSNTVRMLGATSGKVYVEGMDSVTQRNEVRNLLGMCPQHNLFFPDLTVMEHIKFFTMLKGVPFGVAGAEALALAARLGLAGKERARARELSGGMRRRLQLACALAGRAQLLVLDEPTSGLDPETRRALWDLLLELRGERTVVLTTHFMEEADALGDRVAVLHAGRLRCHATPMHLKRALGSGYRLSFTTIGLPKEQAITEAVKSKVPDASLKETSLNTISYNLPAKCTSQFPELFNTLENMRPELAIDSIGVGVTTLEEVFLKLCSDIDTKFSEDLIDGALPVESMKKKVEGASLYWRQFLILLKRQGSYMMAKKFSILTLLVILPIVTMIAITWITLDDDEANKRPPSLLMGMDVYYDMSERRVLYKAEENVDEMQKLMGSDGVTFERTHDVEATMLAKGTDLIEYNKYLIGFEVEDDVSTALYTTTVRHAAPVALNMLSNYLAARATKRSPTFLVHNHPIPRKPTYVEPKSMVNCVFWSTGAVFVLLTTMINLVSLPCKERENGARHLHLLAGCPAAVHWAATLIAHAALTAATLIVPVLIATALMDSDNTFTEPDFLGSMLVILLLGCLAFLSFMYLVSFYFAERVASTVLVAYVVIFGLFTTSLKTATEVFKSREPRSLTEVALSACSFAAPPHTLVLAAARAAKVARLHALCRLNLHRCPMDGLGEDGFDRLECCQLKRNLQCYFCIDNYSPGEFMLILLGQFVVYMILVVLTQDGVFNRLAERVVNKRYRPSASAPTPPSEMVRAEGTYVGKAIALPTEQIQEQMLVNDLHKNYINIFRKSCNAVKGVSFTVKKGECFGLLGVNGAGKSTTFKMVTAEEWPTRGNLFANGYRMEDKRDKYMRSLSYCPQFSGLDSFQSGYGNLALLLTLRGLSDQDVDSEARSWIEVVGLEAAMGRAVGGYSGGMARRLGAGAALACAAPVTLLDEPTAGVDVAARRRVWAALRRALHERRAVVVTSHSMDEMEALCERIAIMSLGRVRALGSAASLRAAHAAGHAVLLKLRPRTRPDTPRQDVTDSSKSDVNKLKSELQQKFNCQLKDEHKTMLHYHINETMRYSDLFSELEALKASNPIVEDYSVTETTLEEVFLSFAKEGEASAEAPITPV